ncbi:MAG: molybdenum ABC transporter ATP-binding protein [Dongiaceae bacterium]
MLVIRAVHRLGGFNLDIDIEASERGVLALYGPSGAGKTSVVNLLAGLLRPRRGRVAIGDFVMFDSTAGIDLPPERRRVGYVFQDGRLFPHFSVRGNLLYGFRRAPLAERALTIDRVVALLGIGPLLARPPRDLSGGEKQRVAIGRALLANPRLLLMDEPLASLDAARKAEILPFIEGLRDELRMPIVYVSHDIGEIIRLGDTVAVIAAGRSAAVGPVEDIIGRHDLRPLTGGHDAGAVLRARVESHDEASALTCLVFPGGRLRIAQTPLPVGREVRVRIRARDVSLALSPPADISILNVLPARIVEIVEDGAQADIKLALDSAGAAAIWASVTRRSLLDLRLAVGGVVFALVKAVAFDRQSLTELTAGRPKHPT